MSEPYLRGKPIVINMSSPPGFYHSYLERFPKELRPRSKEEVGSIVWIRDFRSLVTTYRNGIIGYQDSIEVSVIDNLTKQMIWTTVFEGPKPPREFTYRGGSEDDYYRK
jgi:hypothetical protein